MGLVIIFVAWEVMGGKATTNVVEMRDSDLDPIYNFDSVFPGATYCSFFFSEYLKLSYIRTRYTVEFSPIVIFGLSHYNMCQFSTRSDTMKDRRQRTHNHFKFSTLKYQKYLKS